MTLPKWATTVTSFSKILAMIIFITFPIVGFISGMKYQQIINQPKIEYITREKIVKIPQEDTEKNLIRRCGMIPEKVMTQKGRLDRVSGPTWAPDCRNVAWSLWGGGAPGYYFENEPTPIKEMENITPVPLEKEGVFIFNDSTGKTIRAYLPKKLGEMPVFNYWLNRNVIVFTAEVNEYNYDLTNNSIKLIKK